MRVLFWCGTFWPQIGGVEVLAAKLLPSLRERGHEYIVVTPKTHADLPDEALYKGILVYRFPFCRGFNATIIDQLDEIRQKVAKLKKTFAPHLIHINAVGPADFFHLTTKNAYRAPLLVTLHGKWKSPANTIVGHTLRDADWVVGCSEAILEEGRRLAPEIACRSSVIHNGVEAASLPVAPLPFDPPRLLCLGRLAREKGADLALAAFGMIVHLFPQARLVIAGDGAARGELELQATKQGIGHAVEFTGWVAPEGVPALINDATVVLMPSREDSFPLVALEAARLARPVVATRVGGLPEIVVHQETGLLVESENSRALADAIILLLSNVETTRKLGRVARSRAQKLFSWERHVDAYDALYQKLGNHERYGVST